ncbi:MAG: hypothetical protein ACE5PO_00050 [Candidatus Bathyarchaeia archaeon]
MPGRKAYIAIDIPTHPLAWLTRKHKAEFEIVSSKKGEDGTKWWAATGTADPADYPRVAEALKSSTASGLVEVISLSGPLVVETRIEAFDTLDRESRFEFIPLRISGGRFLCIVSSANPQTLNFAVRQLQKPGVTVEILNEERRVLCG